MDNEHVAIVGAGIVGVCAALQLRLAGFNVTLLDPERPGSQASFGNAGAFAVSDVIPLAEPGIWKKMPGWLLNPLGPLAVRWAYLPHLTPWLWRFFLASRPSRVNQLTIALAALLNRVNSDYAPLVECAGLESQWRRHGSLTLYKDIAEFSQVETYWQKKAKHGVAWDLLRDQAIQQIEPSIDPQWRCAVKVNDWSHVDDPYDFTKGLFDAFLRLGGEFIQQAATELLTEGNQVTGVRVNQYGTILADHTLVTAGIWTRHFTKALGYTIPLESERGYHVDLPHANVDLHHFILSASESFVILPKPDGALRLAGTVELASAEAPPNWQRSHMLLDKAKAIVGDFSTKNMEVWMGNRPSLPDTIPVICKDKRHKGLYFAFGHGHLGLTLGATTAVLIKEMISHQPPSVDLTPYRLDRFSLLA